MICNVAPGVDKHGKYVNKESDKDDLKKYYKVDEDEDDDENDEDDDDKNTLNDEASKRLALLDRMARGEGSDESSSSDNDDEEDEDTNDEDGNADVDENDVHAMGRGVDGTQAYRRIAIVNLDWDHLRAVDLLSILKSFDSTSSIHKVTVYPSDYGMKKMAEEEKYGPQGIWKENTTTPNANDEDGEKQDMNEDEADAFDDEKLREYEVQRLKYYIAVVECDTVEAANVLYEACDGVEIEVLKIICYLPPFLQLYTKHVIYTAFK